jgi:hypothetical protein
LCRGVNAIERSGQVSGLAGTEPMSKKKEKKEQLRCWFARYIFGITANFCIFIFEEWKLVQLSVALMPPATT